MIKVLMLVSNLRVANGVASFVINYYQKLDHSKIQMDFALYSDKESPYYSLIEDCGGKIFVLPSMKKLPEHMRACNKILEDGKYDVVHDNTLHISIPMMWCAKSKGVPVRILHSHSAKFGDSKVKELRNRVFIPVLRSLSTDYTACSNVAGKAMFGYRTFTVIPNVINTKIYQFEPREREYIRRKMNATSKFVVGSVGRMSLEKNPFFAIDIFKKLLAGIPNSEYWWVGSGPLDAEIRNYVKEQGIEDKVRLLGSRDDVVQLYQGMDAFFLPSLFEGLPLTGIEAQATGLPMVVSDAVTNEMVYTDLVDYVSLSEPAAEWITHLKKAQDRKVDRESYSKALKDSAFSDNQCGDKLTTLYKGMLQAHGRK